MDSSDEKGSNWVGRLIRGFVYGACIYVATLIIMPTSALGLTPPQMVLASVGAGLALSLFVTRHDHR